nr:hypothetical protein [Tanacetum cinerariifolium]
MSLTKQERECKLYNKFDKFVYRKGESLRDYYLRFPLLLNDMNIYNMKLEQFQVNTKFLNTLPPEWSKFMTGVRLVRDLHTTNVDQLHAYLGQHEYHDNEVWLMCERTSDPLSLVLHHQMNKSTYQQHQQSYHQHQFQPQASTYKSSPYGTQYHSSQAKATCQSSAPSQRGREMNSGLRIRDFKHTIALMANLSHYGSDNLAETYKQLYGSIKSSRVRSKEQCDDLIKQVNIKSAKNSDLNASLQEKVLVITALKETLSKFKRKAVVNKAVTLHLIDLELLTIDVAPLALKLRNNRTSLTDYLRHTQEETATLREIVKRVNLLSSASRSQLQGNAKNDRIQRTPSKAKKNKLEDHLRTVRPSLNKKKSVVDTKAISSVTNFKLNVGISYETSVVRSLQQNGVMERRNRTLIEAARTMLIYTQAPLFLWAEAVATACYTQNRSIIRLRKLQPKADIRIFIGYAPTKKAFWIYNRRTRRIVETIHVDFDELTALASEQSSSGPALNEMTPATIRSGLVQKPSSSTPYVPPSRNDWDLLFQLLFDELLTLPPSVVPQALEVIAPIADVIPPIQAESSSSPSSTTVDQDAPSPMERKMYKDALTQSCWIEAMQEELNKFERLE